MFDLPILNKGDKVGVIAPASPINEQTLNNGLNLLREWGLKPIVSSNISENRGYLAGSDKDRAADINKMFNNLDISCIWSACGGYGTPRILDMLDYEMIKNNPKPFIGYSDITALHLAFNKMTDMTTFHGPMVATELGNNPNQFTVNNIKNILFGDNKNIILENPESTPFKIINPGTAWGELIGGNLSLLAATIGSKYEVDTGDKVLFIEEVNEEPYRIDRMFAQLKSAGKFDQLRGLILGDFTGCTTETPSLTLSEIFEDYFEEYDFPILSGLQCGHSNSQIIIPIGKKALIDTYKKEVLISFK